MGARAQSIAARKNPVVGLEQAKGATRVSLLRWLRRQLRQAEPLRERLEAAIDSNDVAEARRIVARFEFSPSPAAPCEPAARRLGTRARSPDEQPGCPRRALRRRARPGRSRLPSRRSAAPGRPPCWRTPRRDRSRAAPRNRLHARGPPAALQPRILLRTLSPYEKYRGPVAQLVEQGTFNPKVAGSIPARPIQFAGILSKSRLLARTCVRTHNSSPKARSRPVRCRSSRSLAVRFSSLQFEQWDSRSPPW